MEQGTVAVSNEAAKTGLYYGWVVALASSLGLAAGVSVFLPSTIGLLIGQLNTEFGWTPPQVLAAMTFNTAAVLVAAPMTGKLVDRFGPRKIVIPALIFQALLMASLYFQTNSLTSFYLRYVLFSVFATGTTAAAYSALVSRWFDRKRGLALGIALAGVGVGGIIWSLLSQYLFDLVGWRSAMLYMAVGMVVLVLPVLLITVRDGPQQMGLAPDGVAIAAGADRSDGANEGMTFGEAVRTARFWLIIVTFFLTTAGCYGAILNIVTILTKQGWTAQEAAGVQAMTWFGILIGRAGTGWFLDRIFAPYVAFVLVIPGAIGVALLAAGASGSTAAMAAVLMGLTTGAEIDVVAFLVGRYFGLKNFGSIYSVPFATLAFATSVGPWVVAKIAAANGGSYTPGLYMLVGVLLVAAILLLTFPGYARPAAPRPLS